ncbi:MAG TPA: hypothetical protein VGP05_03980, partial [Pseudonocardia sp.]|nr:hypothetical protein [Pseudonocardia sp.]
MSIPAHPFSSSVTETNASTVFFAEIQPQVDLDASGANRPVTDCGFRGEVADRGVSITTALASALRPKSFADLRRPDGASRRCRRGRYNDGIGPSSALRCIHLDHRIS